MHKSQSQNTKGNPDLPKLDSGFDDLVFREPVISDDEILYDVRRWSIVTEAAKRAVRNSTETRALAREFSSSKLSEELPYHALRALASTDPQVARSARSVGKFMDYLAIDPVPESALPIDIRTAPPLITKDARIERLINARESMSPEKYAAHKQQFTTVDQKGVTSREKKLIIERFGYARDIKLLGLTAELYDSPINPDDSEDGIITHMLESGTMLGITDDAYREYPGILNPESWQGRRQLKDRVYEFTVDDRAYIMKERKTNRHIDTMQHGHKDGLTSEEEFYLSQRLVNSQQPHDGEIEEAWEKSLGFVRFPDGYQFCIFEKIPTMDSEALATFQFADHILKNPETYDEEFTEASKRADAMYSAHQERIDDLLWPGGGRGDTPLSYGEFALLKSRYAAFEAKESLRQTANAQGYDDRDGMEVSFHFSTNHGKAKLVATGYDYEYYNRQDIDEMMQRTAILKESRFESFYIRPERKAGITYAASLSMLEALGWTIDDLDDTE